MALQPIGSLPALCVLFWWIGFRGNTEKWERASGSEKEGKENAKNPFNTEKFMVFVLADFADELCLLTWKKKAAMAFFIE